MQENSSPNTDVFDVKKAWERSLSTFERQIARVEESFKLAQASLTKEEQKKYSREINQARLFLKEFRRGHSPQTEVEVKQLDMDPTKEAISNILAQLDRELSNIPGV